MSFSAGVKEEIAGHIPRGRQERLSSLAALLFNLSRVEIGDSCEFNIVFADGPEKALRKCFTLLKKGLNIDSRLRTDPQEQDSDGTAAAGGPSRQSTGGTPGLTEDDRKKLLDTFGMNMWEETGGVSPGLIRSEKCARAYLMDTFLCVGSVSDPGKEYHLEFNCRSLAHAKQILALLYMLGKSAGFTERKSRFIVYLKDSQDIIDLLEHGTRNLESFSASSLMISHVLSFDPSLTNRIRLSLSTLPLVTRYCSLSRNMGAVTGSTSCSL